MNDTKPEEVLRWKAFLQGDSTAFAAIYESYYHSLYVYGKKFTQDTARVEDAIQELFVTLWRTRDRLSEIPHVRFYLFRSLRRGIYRLQLREERIGEAGFEMLREQEAPAADALFPVFEDEKLLAEK